MFEEENEEKDIHTEEGGERTEVDKWDTKEEKEMKELTNVLCNIFYCFMSGPG